MLNYNERCYVLAPNDFPPHIDKEEMLTLDLFETPQDESPVYVIVDGQTPLLTMFKYCKGKCVKIVGVVKEVAKVVYKD